MRGNFVGDSAQDRLKWFDVENYVKVMTDHVRSRMRRIAKTHGIQDFYRDTIDIVRNTLLGEPNDDGDRPGLVFEEFGFHVYDVEVLAVDIQDSDVAQQLQLAQSHALKEAIRLSEAEDAAVRTMALEELSRQNLDSQMETTRHRAELDAEKLQMELEAALAQVAKDLQTAQARVEVDDLALAREKLTAEQRNALTKAADEVAIAKARAETEDYVKRLEALNENVGTALPQFGDKIFVEQLVKAFGPLAATMGLTNADLLAKVLEGTGFQDVMETLGQRPLARVGSNGDHS